MAGRNSHFSNTSIFFTFLVIGFALLLSPAKYTSKISLFFYDTFESIIRIGRDDSSETVRLNPDSEDIVSKSEYVSLCKSYKNLIAQRTQLLEQYQRLANVRAALPESFYGVVLANVTSRTGNYSHELIINKGSEDFIRQGQYVLSENEDCLIGAVAETSRTAARVRLLTDEMQTLDILIRREGSDKNIRAMMFGNGKNACKVPNMDKELNIREGDTVYAAPVPGMLDVPLVVGEVVDVRPYEMDQLLWDITVKIAEDLSQINDVAVIVPDESLLIETN